MTNALLKKKYVKPLCAVHIIYLENPISAGSKAAVSGGKQSDYSPDVQDWGTPDSETKGFEF